MAQAWGYNETNGPCHWQKQFPIAEEGKRQSPIDLELGKVQYDATLKPIEVSYPIFNGATLSNTGHSVLFSPPEAENNSELKGGPLAHKYKLAQFHLHWGNTDDAGSEHRVDGKMYAAELHLVHWNTELYKDVGTALTSTDGLCVLGIFLEVDNNAGDHAGLKDITDLLKNVTAKGSKIEMTKPFNPKSLLPGNTDYMTYPGSLTTPPLSESVTWVVFKEPMKVSRSQIEAFRAMTNVEDKPMGGNFRPPCPMNGRVVKASYAKES